MAIRCNAHHPQGNQHCTEKIITIKQHTSSQSDVELEPLTNKKHGPLSTSFKYILTSMFSHSPKPTPKFVQPLEANIPRNCKRPVRLIHHHGWIDQRCALFDHMLLCALLFILSKDFLLILALFFLTQRFATVLGSRGTYVVSQAISPTRVIFAFQQIKRISFVSCSYETYFFLMAVAQYHKASKSSQCTYLS